MTASPHTDNLRETDPEKAAFRGTHREGRHRRRGPGSPAFLGLPPERVPAIAREIRPGARELHPHVVARAAKIRRQTRAFRERFGY